MAWSKGNKMHTQTRPFNPTANSKDRFFPRTSRTGHVGELNSLQVKVKFCHYSQNKISAITFQFLKKGVFEKSYILDKPVDDSNI